VKEDKYCYTLPAHANLPASIPRGLVDRVQKTIGDYLAQEKHLRKASRQAGLVDMRGTLNADFAKRVKTEQEAEKKKLEERFKARGNLLHAVNQQILRQSGGPEDRGAVIAGSKVVAPVRSDMYKATGYMPTIQHRNYDPVIEQFEQRYVAARPDVGAIRDELTRRVQLLKQSFDFGFRVVSDADTIRFYLQGDVGDELLAAVVYLGDARFAVKAQATLSTRPIHAHIGNGREYVRDANGVFVKRYVYRNMSAHDDPWTKDGFLSRNGKVPEGSDMNQVILKHLRAAEQGSSYFISFTTTRQPIFGSTGTSFYDPAKGQVIVDLAKVDQARIYDVHSARAVNQVITNADLRWGVQFNPGDADYEKNAAARDTVRTRELLVEEKVPGAAIVSIRKAGKHDGEWRDLDGSKIMTSALPPELFPLDN